MNENEKEFTAKDIQVDRGFASLRELKKRIQDGTFGEILDDWRWIFTYSLRYKWIILFYLALGLFSTCMGQFSAYLNIDIVNIITGKQSDRLWFLVLISVGSMLFSLTVGNYIGRISTKISIDINNDIQHDIFTKIMDADWMSISRYSNGDVMNRFNGDTSTVSGNAISWIPSVILAMVNFFIILGIMWKIDHVVALLAFISAPFTLLASRIVVKKQREYGKKVREMSSDMMSFEVETFYNMDTIKSFGIADQYTGKLKWWQKRFKNIQLDYNMFSIKTSIYMSLVGYGVSSICFFYCLFRMWKGYIDYGQMTYILSQRSSLSSAFSSIISIIPSFLNSSVSAHRIKELIDLPREVHIPTSSEMDRFADQGYTIEMDDVNYAYIENKKVITDSVFIANPGEIVALVGPSGEGKTTMIRLILGLIRPQDGHVLLKGTGTFEPTTVPGSHTCDSEQPDGDNPESYNTPDGSNPESHNKLQVTQVEMNTETRHLFAYVPQGNTIISGTIAENLRMVKEDATDDEIIEALKLSCAWDFVKDIPDTINAKIGERGRGFSEGQAQRIAIARAVLRNSPILLLDEATSALDVTTERQVLRNIIQQRPNKTIIVTTHRPSVLNMCQRVYRVMETHVTELSEEESSRMAIDF